MLRAVSVIAVESSALELLASAAARRDFSKLIRIKKYSSAAPHSQTVLSSEKKRAENAPPAPAPGDGVALPVGGAGAGGAGAGAGAGGRRAWALTAAVAAAAASLGGVYFYRKLSEEEPAAAGAAPAPTPGAAAPAPEDEPYPADGAQLPRHVHCLLVGGGTASFAALRALRAARPDAAVLLVGEEPLPPYMRPPLSKELWREPEPAAALSFRQWNGKRRALLYEPAAFYTPVERLAAGGAAAARGWRVARLHPARRTAELEAPGRAPVTVSYDQCLLAPGVRPRRLEALRGARAAGRAVAVRGARDAARLARLVDAAGAGDVLVVGGGFLGTELAAALAARLAPGGARVTLLCRGPRVLHRVLPPYLADEAAARLRAAGVRVLPACEVLGSAATGPGAVEVRVRDAAGERSLRAAAVAECAGAELDAALARGAGLELAAGGLAVTAELQARHDVWAAGDAACWHDPALGRRRAEHHDHAVASGRRAGENMAAAAAGLPQRVYDHQPMFWSDLGPDLGYEGIGLVDSRLDTVGVFSDHDVKDVPLEAAESGPAPDAAAAPATTRRYERGVVFYTREGRVVGVLLWNLFNRMHVARQVLAQGHFDDLFEVAKLFSLHEDE